MLPSADPFEALGDPTRREILRLLSAGDKPVHEIAATLPISRPAVSRHLRLLKDAGLVAERAEASPRVRKSAERRLADEAQLELLRNRVDQLELRLAELERRLNPPAEP